MLRKEAMFTSAVENNSVKDWDIEPLFSYLGYDEKHVLYVQEITDSNANPKKKSAELRKQIRKKVAELREVDLKSVPYPHSDKKLSEYFDEISNAELSQQKKSKSVEHRKEAQNRVAELKEVDSKSTHCDEIDDAELSQQKRLAKNRTRKEARIRLAELKGVDLKSIEYPRSNIKLSEYQSEIQRLEAERKFQKEYQLEKLTEELKEKEKSSYNSLKKYEIEDKKIKDVTQTAYNLDENNKEQRLSNAKTIDSDGNKENHSEQIIEKSKSSVETKQIKKDYSASHSDKAIVDISYREDKEGKAAFWDHYTFQRITKYPTRVVGTTNDASLLKMQIKDKTYGLPISPADSYKPTPPIIGPYPYSSNDLHGLLLIPGSHADSNECQNYEDRMKNEENLIKDARNRGRPVLGICDGGLKIWKFFGGEEIKVHNHSARKMPYLTQNGRVGHNTEIHHLRINLGSILADAMYGKATDKLAETYPVANSVHNKAMSSKIVPPNLKIAAWSVKRSDKAPSNLSPEENAVEAAETCHGAPMLLIQWHPEAYNSDDTDAKYHRGILTYMAKAGDTYYRKQEMLLELKKLCQSPEGLIKIVLKQTKKNRRHKVDKVSESKKSKKLLFSSTIVFFILVVFLFNLLITCPRLQNIIDNILAAHVIV